MKLLGNVLGIAGLALLWSVSWQAAVGVALCCMAVESNLQTP